MIFDTIQPPLLIWREGLPCRNLLKSTLDPFACREQRTLTVCGVLHHRDNIDERFLILDLVCFLQAFYGETLRSSLQLFCELRECLGAPFLGAFLQNSNCFDVV